jgi:hypothetical protein
MKKLWATSKAFSSAVVNEDISMKQEIELSLRVKMLVSDVSVIGTFCSPYSNICS